MKEYLSPILVGIIVAIGGGYATFQLQLYYEKVQKIEYRITKSESILSNAKEMSDSLKVMFDGKELRNISEVDVELFNRTNKDFEDVVISITLYPVLEQQVKLVSSTIHDSNRSKNDIEFQPVTQTEKTDAGAIGITLNYNIKIANRMGLSPVFSARYFVEGNYAPKVEVKVRKLGVEAIEFIPDTSIFDGSVQQVSAGRLILVVLLLVAFTSMAALSVLRMFREKRLFMRQQKVFERITRRVQAETIAEIPDDFTNDEKLKEFKQKIIDYSRNFDAHLKSLKQNQDQKKRTE